jgi:glutaredoxin
MKNITVISMEGCPHCEELKKLLTEEAIIFNEIDIEKQTNRVEYIFFKFLTQSDYVPGLTIIDKENFEVKCYAADQNFTTIKEALEICKNLQ